MIWPSSHLNYPIIIIIIIIIIGFFKLRNLQTIPYKNMHYKIAKQRG